MAEIIRLRSSPHEEVQRLLPWLVNGSLAPGESKRVAAHLEQCIECRAEFAAERKLADAVARLPIRCDSSSEKVGLRLDHREATELRPPLLSKRVPLGWAVASPLAAAAAVALVFMNVGPNRPAEPQYHALGTIGTAQPPNVIVQFEPATRVSDMQEALRSVDARLVDGPTETGAYMVRVDRDRRELALKQLRDNQTIALAEPIDAAIGP